MSILNALTPVEKRFLDEALGLAEAKLALEDAEEVRRHRKEIKQHADEEEEQEEEAPQQSILPLEKNHNKKKSTRLGPRDAVDRFSQQLQQEIASWEEVKISLEYPFVYRSDKNKDLCLKMLRRIPRFESLVESDLVVIAAHMEILRVRGKMVLAGSLPIHFCPAFLPTMSTAPAVPTPPNEVDELLSLIELPTGDAERKRACEHAIGEAHLNNHVYVLLCGRVVLRMPMLKTSVESFVEPYEVFALPVTVNALPEGSWYETDGECMLLRLTRGTDLALDRLIGDLEKRVIQERVLFLRRQLRVKVFTHWTAEDYEEAARLLVPLRASWRQVVVTQGMESDAMYFIKEGQCVVARNIPLLHQQQQERGREPRSVSAFNQPHTSPQWQRIRDLHSGRNTAMPSVPVDPILSSVRLQSLNTKLVEIVTLREGEFFGELGLLNHNVDWKPDVERIWSKKNWHDVLLGALQAPVNYDALEDTASWCSSRRVLTDDHSMRTGISSPKQADTAFPPASRQRQATVYTKSTCVLYMLTHDHCRNIFDEREYAQLKEFAKGYPSCEDIEGQYNRHRKWAHYRKALVNDVLLEPTGFARQQTKLPPLRFH
ncbi:putative cyclic nucleotide-binding domain containing protein [Trypanosoma cruzi]|nr:putative cyclic nucleotide-binding domain containing protein [Trypanosoma cruzi]